MLSFSRVDVVTCALALSCKFCEDQSFDGSMFDGSIGLQQAAALEYCKVVLGGKTRTLLFITDYPFIRYNSEFIFDL